MRELLRDYVLILANTGMRHGTEAQNLRWKHISIIRAERALICCDVGAKEKRNPRELIARHSCLTYLKRIHQRCPDIANMTFDELLAIKIRQEHVFRLPDGTVTKISIRLFGHSCVIAGCSKIHCTEQNRTLYSLRHMYATFQIVYGGTDLHLLARQMGTSIAMIEHHYSSINTRLRADKLAGRVRA